MDAKVETKEGTTTPGRWPLDFVRAVRLSETDAVTALAQAKTAFALEGFMLLAATDLGQTLEPKLDKKMAPLWLVDFCNPNLADRALTIARDLALLMPCRVAVWQEGPNAVVAALRPVVAAAVAGLDELEPIGREAERHLERALVRLESPGLEPPLVSEEDEPQPSEI